MELVKKEEKNSRYYDDITQVKGFRIICYLYLGAKRCTIKIMQKNATADYLFPGFI